MNVKDIFNKLAVIKSRYAAYHHDGEIARARLDDARQLGRELLEQCRIHPGAERYIRRILNSLEGIAHPDITLLTQAGLYNEYFDASAYLTILNYTRLAYVFERAGSPEEHAFKLQLMLATPEKVFRYWKEMASVLNHDAPLVHDSCLFVLPDVQGNNFSAWRTKAQKSVGHGVLFMSEGAFRQLLPHSQNIRAMFPDNILRHKFPDTAAINESTRQLIADTRLLKSLKCRHGELEDAEVALCVTLVKRISGYKQALCDLYLGLVTFDKAGIDILKYFFETYRVSTDTSYAYFVDHGLSATDHDRFKQLLRIKDDIAIPDICMKAGPGALSDYYFVKLNEMDDLDAALACCLGKLTDCCQSLSGESGESCTIHGLTSRDGGFYVLRLGDWRYPSIKDPVIAQSWVWRAVSGAICFDSIETASIKPLEKQQIAMAFRALAYKMVEHHGIPAVVCGKYSGISRAVGLSTTPFVMTLEVPRDYTGYRDSHEQLCLADPDRLFMLFGNIPDEDMLHASYRRYLEFELTKGALKNNRHFTELATWLTGDAKSETSHRAVVLDFVHAVIGETRWPEFEIMLENNRRYLNKLKSGVIDFELLASGCHVNSGVGESAIHIAATQGDLDSIRKLMDAGADLEMQNAKGYTPITLAIDNRLVLVAITLAAAGVKIRDRWMNFDAFLAMSEEAPVLLTILEPAFREYFVLDAVNKIPVYPKAYAYLFPDAFACNATVPADLFYGDLRAGKAGIKELVSTFSPTEKQAFIRGLLHRFSGDLKAFSIILASIPLQERKKAALQFHLYDCIINPSENREVLMSIVRSLRGRSKENMVKKILCELRPAEDEFFTFFDLITKARHYHFCQQSALFKTFPYPGTVERLLTLVSGVPEQDRLRMIGVINIATVSNLEQGEFIERLMKPLLKLLPAKDRTKAMQQKDASGRTLFSISESCHDFVALEPMVSPRKYVGHASSSRFFVENEAEQREAPGERYSRRQSTRGI